jgi:NADH-quinone oxidoreductase subunit L
MVTYIVFLPLLGALITGLFTRSVGNKFAQIVTSSFLMMAAILSWLTFCDVVLLGHKFNINVLRWIDVGAFSVSWSFMVDGLTAVMLVVVTTVSSLVHIYSIGYMSHDPHVPRFMSYLSFFTFFMLLLVTSDNLLQLFVGWEGVGLCSYLLIGFWFKKESANRAAMKAFIVNRVGDFAFVLGIFAIFIVFDSVRFAEIFTMVANNQEVVISLMGADYNAITVICVLLFIGAMGKSAQIGLHTWLPDAMEGPTPVSALIHAATMVTAGVFLVARCSPLFEYSEVARNMVMVVGACTALFAATIALVQNDIKKVIAYSTCSQLGYMFFACGASAYPAAVFHLGTHAFFKALLFLGAGSVIHAVSNEQDLRKMGGLWKKIPITYTMMWIGSLALVGIWPFAGYYSKDTILEAAFASSNEWGRFAYWMGIVAAFCTAFYSWRLIIMAFHGAPRAPKDIMKKVHESPLTMLLPLFMLAFGAVFSGMYGANILHIVSGNGEFWNGAIKMLEQPNTLVKAHDVPSLIKLMPLFVGVAGIGLAYLFYMYCPAIPKALANMFQPIHKFLLNKWYFDEAYDYLFVRPTKYIGRRLWKCVDVGVIDNLGPNGSAKLSHFVAKGVGKMQSGYLYTYAFVMIVGMLAIVSWYVMTALISVG